MKSLAEAQGNGELSFESLSFVAESKYLMLVQKKPVTASKSGLANDILESKSRKAGLAYGAEMCMQYTFFRVADGERVLEFSNAAKALQEEVVEGKTRDARE